MKATVIASSLNEALKSVMKKTSSPQLIFNDDGVFVNSSQVKLIRVTGEVESNGWGHIEYDRAEKIVKVLDALGDIDVTISYEGNYVRLTDVLL